MEEGWLAREIERTEKIIDEMPGGWEAVRYAQIRAEEANRAEAEAYREQQERRNALKPT
jgi:hypothetical protein